MARQANGGSGGRQENKRWSLIHGPRFLTVFLVISMIHVATSQDKMSTLDQGSNNIRSPRYAKTTGKTNTQSNRVCNTTECVLASKDIKKSMNLTVDPCDDFYEYACGMWPKHNPFPPGFTHYNQFQVADTKTDEYKKRKLEMAKITVKGASTEVQKMPSDLYHSCIDVKTIESLGDNPLSERITELGGWSMIGKWDEDTWDFNKTLLSMHKMKHIGGPLFLVGFVPSGINKTNFIVQGGTTLDKVHYLNISSKTIQAYRQLIIDVVVLLGGNPSTTAKKADEIIRLEAQLANVSLDKEEEHLLLTTNRTIEQLQREVPKFDWLDYFNELLAPATIPQSEIIVVPPLSYLKKALEIIENTSKSVLANYMVWYKIQSEIQWLSKPFRDAKLKYKQATAGAKSDKELWKKCVDSAFYAFDDIISAAYINDHHAVLAGPITMAKQMLKEEIKAFKENVNSLTWLDGPTRSGVFEKLDGMGERVGFPDYMLDRKKMATIFEKYRGLKISRKEYFKNKVSIIKNKQQQKLKSFRKPTDETIWDIFTPLTGSVLYVTVQNKLTIPAAVLGPPFVFLNKFLRAYNLGNLGSVMNHALVYGFSIRGKSYDKKGKPKNWWSNDSLIEFNKRVKCYHNQYSKYRIFGKYPINLENTANENMVDNEELKIATKAYYNWANENPSETWQLPGLNVTNEQLFFVGFAQSHCSSSTRERRIQDSKSEPHADFQFRTIGPLANSCEFAKAFKCKKNSPMNPVNKCYLWSKGPLV